MSLEPKEIGRRIAAAREQRGWTQLAFALEANVSPSSIARWEAGKLPPVRELMRIAGVLGVEVEQFVEPASPEDGDRFDELSRELAEVRDALRGLDDLKAALARIEAALPAAADDAR